MLVFVLILLLVNLGILVIILASVLALVVDPVGVRDFNRFVILLVLVQRSHRLHLFLLLSQFPMMMLVAQHKNQTLVCVLMNAYYGI